MRMVKTGLMAAALVVGVSTAVSAQSVEIRSRSVAPGHMMQDDDEVSSTRVIRRSGTVERRVVREPSTTATVTTRRGASYYAPGQVKKRVTVQSARDYAPGRLMNDDDDDTTSTTTVRRRVRTLD
jgi:hypothetical protein